MRKCSMVAMAAVLACGYMAGCVASPRGGGGGGAAPFAAVSPEPTPAPTNDWGGRPDSGAGAPDSGWGTPDSGTITVP